MLVFDEGKAGVAGEKTLRAEERTNKLDPNIASRPGHIGKKASAIYKWNVKAILASFSLHLPVHDEKQINFWLPYSHIMIFYSNRSTKHVVPLRFPFNDSRAQLRKSLLWACPLGWLMDRFHESQYKKWFLSRITMVTLWISTLVHACRIAFCAFIRSPVIKVNKLWTFWYKINLNMQMKP